MFDLVIRNGTVFDGTGAPPQGPVDIVITGNRIAEVRPVGVPGVPIQAERRPAKRRAAARARGKPRGLGLATAMELAGGPYTAVNPDTAARRAKLGDAA